MNKSFIPRSIFLILLPIGLLLVLALSPPPSSENELPGDPLSNYKQKGAHVYGIRDSTDLELLARNNIEWVTLIAWAGQDDYDSPRVRHHNGDSVLIWRTDSSFVKRIELIHAGGFKVFVKPHVWIDFASEGKWRSDIFPSSEENWELWKASYREYITRYAKIAEQGGAEMFCIGTEFSRLAVEKPMFWRELIREVREIYSGEITYAANWYHEFEEVTFWEDLDYIGVQAYFPLAGTDYPSVQEISEGWSEHLPALEAIHKKYDRKILFTELGYKCTPNSATRPWEWIEDISDRDTLYSAETQANCYKAFFNSVWDQEWLAGVHLWVLNTGYAKGFKENKLNFSPLGKPAEKVIAKGFK